MDKTRQKTGHARHMQSCKRAIVSSGHAWLFANQWVEASADEIEDENYDFSKRGRENPQDPGRHGEGNMGGTRI
jgi:hypothetical protein